MTIHAVKNMLTAANEAANDYTQMLIDSGAEIRRIDKASDVVCLALMHNKIEPDHRVAMAQELVELQSERRQIVNKILEAMKE